AARHARGRASAEVDRVHGPGKRGLERLDLAPQRGEVGLDGLVAAGDGREVAVRAPHRAEREVEVDPGGFGHGQTIPTASRGTQPFRPFGRLTWIHSSRSARTSSADPSCTVKSTGLFPEGPESTSTCGASTTARFPPSSLSLVARHEKN